MMKHILPRKGIWTETPAQKWEDALVSGNGSHGVMVFGDPIKDTIVGNHCRLYLPQGNSDQLPEMAPYLDKVREIIRTKGYEEAIAYYYRKSTELGYEGLTMSDPYHPGFHLFIETDHHNYSRYRRSIDYETGELQVSYQVNHQSYRRKTFVSQTNNAIIHELSPGNYHISLKQYVDKKMKQRTVIEENVIHAQFDYEYSDAGYDVWIQVIGADKLITSHEAINICATSPTILVMKIIPYDIESKRSVFSKMIENGITYTKLFQKHCDIHRDRFERVELSLTTDHERLRSIDDIVLEAKRNKSISPVLLEKMYDAGRYMYICSAGELTPNLQGIWTGTFEPAWSGDFTFDTNVELSIAAALSSHQLEGMQGYFRLIKELIPEFRENAKKYYGARGVMAAIHASNSGKHLHWNEDWPLHFWTCGAGWLAHWYFQYYRFTGDKIFLKEEAIPFLKEIVLFYEDFLIEDEDGTYRFTPSYSAENGCADNATQDIAVAKEVLTNLMIAHDILSMDSPERTKWQQMLQKLPAYQINEDGALKEWLTPGKEENYNHRHFSHLYPVFQSREFNEITDPKMWRAAKIAFDKRLEAWLLNKEADTSSTHGRMHSALCATQFHMPDLVEEVFHLLVKNNCFYTSLMMSHYNDQEVFNVDGNGALPQVVHEMLVDYSHHRLTLLGALPNSLKQGEIRGIRLPEQMQVTFLKWDLTKKNIAMELLSEIEQTLEVYLPLYSEADVSEKRFTLYPNQPKSLVIQL